VIAANPPPLLADLEFTHESGVDPPQSPGGERRDVRLRLVIHNAGPAAAIEPRLRVSLPSDVVVQGFLEGGEWCRVPPMTGRGRVVSCRFPDLLPNVNPIRVVMVLTVGPERTVGTATVFSQETADPFLPSNDATFVLLGDPE
jgi:hypothetical protein